jgi:hypothetical protein
VLQPGISLNISTQVNSVANERGLLGLAFHPDYASNGFFYVYSSNVIGSSIRMNPAKSS